MAGNIAMNNYQVTGLAAASGTGEAVRFDEWTGGQDPGHKHSKLWAADGSSEAVTTDTGANVGIGKTPSLPYKLDIAGSLASSQTTTLRYVENGCELRTMSVATSSATHKPSPYSQWKASIWNGSTAAEKIMMSQLQGISGEDSQYFMETASSDVANILCLRGDTGYIGIGTNSPQEELQVVGNLFLSHKYKPGNPYGDHTSKLWMSPWTNTVGTGNYNALVLARYSFTNPFTIMAGPDTLNIINVINGYDTIFGENGYVGIGTTSPGKKLDVDGYLRGIGIFNTLNSAPADEDIAAGECALWFDKTDGAAKLMIKAKQNDETVKTASISLN